MKDFALDENGDILITGHDAVLIQDSEQEIQKIRQVIGTKLGEWEYDVNEGIDFDAFSQKHPDLQRIRETLSSALQYIDEDYILEDCSYDTENRTLAIYVSAEKRNESAESGQYVLSWRDFNANDRKRIPQAQLCGDSCTADSKG